jgi:hypothetical protein
MHLGLPDRRKYTILTSPSSSFLPLPLALFWTSHHKHHGGICFLSRAQPSQHSSNAIASVPSHE